MLIKKQRTPAKNPKDYGEKRISKVIYFAIFIFPFATFMGAYTSVFGVNISNLYSLFLCALVIRNLLKARLKNVSWYVSFFFVMLLYALYSITWGKYGDVGLSIIFPLMTGFVAMTFVASLNENELRLLLKSLSIFTVVVLIMSLVEIYTERYFFFNNKDFIYSINMYHRHYPGVVFANPNDLSQYLLVGFPLLIFGLLEKKKLVAPIILFAATIFVMINSSSRLSIILTVIIVAFYALITMFRKRNKFIFLLIGLVAVFFLLPYVGIDFSQYNIINNFLKVDSSQGYVTGREAIYSKAFELGLSHVIFGAGLGGSYAITGIGTHNMFLFIFSDMGIVFAFGFIIVLVSSFLAVYKYKNFEICGQHLGTIMLSILIIFPLFSSMSSGNEQRKIVWLALGLVFAVISNSRVKRASLRLSHNFDRKSEEKRSHTSIPKVRSN